MTVHFGPNGPGECNAQPGNCPFGNVPHFDSMEEARAAYEKSMEAQGKSFANLKRAEPFTRDELEEARSRENRRVSEIMTERYGSTWTVLVQEGKTAAYDHWRGLSSEAEEYDRRLKGYLFSPSGEEPTEENLSREKQLLEGWIETQYEELDENWRAREDETRFVNELMPLYERIEAIDMRLKTLNS